MAQMKSIVENVDYSQPNADFIKEALKCLIEEVEEKTMLFEELIREDLTTGRTTDNLSIPITRVLATKKEYRAKTANGTSDFINDISVSLNTMFNGDNSITTSIASIVNTGLQELLGIAKGEEAELRQYCVVVEHPAIIRFDFAFWSRNIKSEALRSSVENVFACLAYKSAVDIRHLEFNEFLALYAPILRKAYGDNETKLLPFIKKAQDIYKLSLPMSNVINPAPAELLKIINKNNEDIFTLNRKTHKATKGDF